MSAVRLGYGRSAAIAALSALVALAAGVGLQSSSAGASVKPAQFDFSQTSIPAAASTPVTLTITNQSANQSLGSANITAAVGPAPSGTLQLSDTDYVQSQGSIDPTSSSTVLKLRNLNLAPGAHMTVMMNQTAPCAAGTYTWSIRAKQSNDFNGPPGNDFLVNGGTQPTTTVTGSCKLVFGVGPHSAFQNTTITGTPYTPSGSDVTVFVEDPGNPGQPIAGVTGSVTLHLVDNGAAGCAGSLAGNFSDVGNAVSFDANGVATFDSLSSSAVATGCQLYATSGSYQQSDKSDAFDISYGSPCSGGVCPTSSGTIDGSAKLDAGAIGAFTFLAFNTSSIPTSVTAPGGSGGCAGFQSVYTAINSSGGVFNETDSGATGSTTKTFRYYINKKLVQKKFGNNSGQQFIPICAGGERLGDNGQPINCVTDQAAGRAGWTSKKIDPVTGLFTTGFTPAVCDPGTGLWWGILSSFQDYNNYPSGTTPSNTPNVTGWNSDTTYRWFDISVPSPWDWRAGT